MIKAILQQSSICSKVSGLSYLARILLNLQAVLSDNPKSVQLSKIRNRLEQSIIQIKIHKKDKKRQSILPKMKIFTVLIAIKIQQKEKQLQKSQYFYLINQSSVQETENNVASQPKALS